MTFASTSTTQDPAIEEQFQQLWVNKLSENAQTVRDLIDVDQHRFEFTNYMRQRELEGRTLYFMTFTYKPQRDQNPSKHAINKHFINIYTQLILPLILKTKNIHTVAQKRIQPICLSFLDEHQQTAVYRKSATNGTTPRGPSIVFPLRLHHHAILAVHPDHVPVLDALVGENTIPKAFAAQLSQLESKYQKIDPEKLPARFKFAKLLMTTDLRRCDAATVIYASKKYSQYRDYLMFPDKFHSSRSACFRQPLPSTDQKRSRALKRLVKTNTYCAATKSFQAIPDDLQESINTQ